VGPIFTAGWRVFYARGDGLGTRHPSPTAATPAPVRWPTPRAVERVGISTNGPFRDRSGRVPVSRHRAIGPWKPFRNGEDAIFHPTDPAGDGLVGRRRTRRTPGVRRVQSYHSWRTPPARFPTVSRVASAPIAAEFRL